MSAVLLSQDFLGICLVLSCGNVDTNLAEIIKRAELFQETQNWHFGISRTDFRNSLYVLAEADLLRNSFECMTSVTLRDVLTKILKHESVYFNDEGEYWDLQTEHDGSYIRCVLGYGDEEYKAKSATKQSMVEFFINSGDIHKPEEVREFMAQTGLSESILYSCSRSGNSS
jgi:hypothetical protein